MDCARMARVFLLYILGSYLFANGRQTLSLRWLALFRDFGVARGLIEGRHVLPICTHA